MDGYYDIRGINEHVVGLFYYGIGSPRNIAMFNKVTRVVEKSFYYSNFDNEVFEKFVNMLGGNLICR